MRADPTPQVATPATVAPIDSRCRTGAGDQGESRLAANGIGTQRGFVIMSAHAST
jgi:hypothetical protein